MISFFRKLLDPIIYEVGSYWVMPDAGVVKVYCASKPEAECIATFPATMDGLTLAMSYADLRYNQGRQ